MERVERITEQIRLVVSEWRLAPVVEAIQALREVSLVVATTIIAELGEIGRFDSPRQLIAYIGLVPSEHSSGENIKRRSITKTAILSDESWSKRHGPTGYRSG